MDRIPGKKKGDRLLASEVNALGRSAAKVAFGRPGSHVAALTGPSSYGQSVEAPHVQRVVRVKGQLLQEDGSWREGRYTCEVRWFDETYDRTGVAGTDDAVALGWATDEGHEWELDASDLWWSLLEGDLLVAWWDAQRGAFVPCSSQRLYSGFDASGHTGSSAIPTTGGGSSDVRFALEVNSADRPWWGVVSNRVCRVNGNVLMAELEPGLQYAHCSGCMIYTLNACGTVRLRVRANTDITELYDGNRWVSASVLVEGVGVRLRAAERVGVYVATDIGDQLGTVQGQQPGPNAVTISSYDALDGLHSQDVPRWVWPVQADPGDSEQAKWIIPDRVPRIEVNGEEIVVTTPDKLNPEQGHPASEPWWLYETWGLEIEVSGVFVVAAEESSLTEVSSESSWSSESSTSSSSTSSSSTTSSRTITFVTDVYCNGPDIVVCTTDITFAPYAVESVAAEVCL